MDAGTFKRLSAIAYASAGIVIKPGKEALVTARVAKRLRALGMSSDKEYLRLLQRDETGEELVNFLDVISTNFTAFAREQEHFDVVTRQMRRWLAHGQRDFTFWCAASSTGEEPYTLAVTLEELRREQDFSYRVLATDISTRALAVAEHGQYSISRLEPIGKRLRLRYFTSIPGPNQAVAWCQAGPALTRSVVFKRLNLAHPPFPMGGPFDIVLCRNVMIYFDRSVRQGLVREVERLLRPDGLLLTGHAETLTGLERCLTMVRPSIYRKLEAPVDQRSELTG